MSEMIECVARAIFNADLQSVGRTVLWTDDPSWPSEQVREAARRGARAAIAAMREPNSFMLHAAGDMAEIGERHSTAVWIAMIDAALSEGRSTSSSSTTSHETK